MRRERGHRARDRRHAGHHRHRDGQHVVDQQRRRRHQRGILAEVRAADGVGAAAIGVGVAGLAIRRHDDDQQQHDRRRQPRRQMQQREPAETQHEHHLLGGVRNRGQRIRTEHRQRQPLRQQRLVQPVAPQRLPHERSSNSSRRRAHAPVLASTAALAADLDVALAPHRRTLTDPWRRRVCPGPVPRWAAAPASRRR